MKTLLWIVIGTIIIFCALAIGTGLMTANEVFDLAKDTANTAAEVAQTIVK